MRHLLFVLLLAPAVASAEIYRWTDAQGRVHFSEKPGGAGAEQVEVKPQVVERDDATREREQRSQQYFDARRDERAQAESRAASARAERSAECGKLRQQLQQIERNGRYFTTDANGERNYVSEAEVEAARSRLSSRIAARCG
ncbi:DUF4124 domain-containing protein [Pseudomonas sp. BMS12]|uniref:DUF4124 domain-containing protein n=1 Tax=Pseudomonas sp. BMS12 TaxID=1796033 RepID=UPI00083A00B6|nr:DUF4124 domain-containing protein [Pseudomonas sp. BMS12]